VIDRPEHTSAKIAFRKTILGPHLQVAADAVVVERPWQVTDSIQLVPHSIGYTSLGEIISENPALNVVSVNGVAPTPGNLNSGQYKFFRPFGMVVGRNPSVSTMRFINFIFSETGAKIIGKSGYKPHRYEILIGIVPEQNIMVQNQRYEPLAKYLSKKLDNRFTVKLKLYPSYIEVCRDLAKGDINAAFLGSLAYATVRKYVDVLARPDYSGVSTYRGLIFVRADSDIKSLEQMRGKRLVLGGKTTTAGYVFPLFYFKANGIPEYWKFFSEYRFAGTHEDAILAVLSGEADVGAAKDLILRMLARENPQIESDIRILAESPPVPSNAFVIRKSIDLPCFDCHQRHAGGGGIGADIESELKLGDAIRNHLLAMDSDPEGKAALAAIGNAQRFLDTTDSDYAKLNEMLEEIRLNPEDFLRHDARLPSGAN
jgi:phosphate/phosphite/phosphonate ABC transporter binding protein